jgi:hypothetical protein
MFRPAFSPMDTFSALLHVRDDGRWMKSRHCVLSSSDSRAIVSFDLYLSTYSHHDMLTVFNRAYGNIPILTHFVSGGRCKASHWQLEACHLRVESAIRYHHFHLLGTMHFFGDCSTNENFHLYPRALLKDKISTKSRYTRSHQDPGPGLPRDRSVIEVSFQELIIYFCAMSGQKVHSRGLVLVYCS